MKLGEALVNGNLITQVQLKEALERQVIFGGRIGTNLVELGFIKEEDIMAFFGKFFMNTYCQARSPGRDRPGDPCKH